MRVLVADRDLRFTVALGRHFARKGWEVAAAADAPRALDRAGTLRPDLIVLDLELSDGEGMVLLQLLKAAPSTGLIPVVALSASDEAIVEQMARVCGAARFARKPIDPARVCTIVGALGLGDAPRTCLTGAGRRLEIERPSEVVCLRRASPASLGSAGPRYVKPKAPTRLRRWP